MVGDGGKVQAAKMSWSGRADRRCMDYRDMVVNKAVCVRVCACV